MNWIVSAIMGVIVFVLAASPAQAAKPPAVPTGWIVFSIESDGKRETNQQLQVRRHGMEKTWLISTPGLWGTKYHFDTPVPGSVVVKELPQGDYVTMSISSQVGNAIATVPIQVPFMVEGGKATYLGAFRPDIHDSKGWFGAQIPTSVSYNLYDERPRDLPLAASLLPEGTEVLENFAGYAE